MPSVFVTKFGVLVEIEETEADMATHFTRSGGKRKTFQRLPEAVTGYALDPEHSFWSMVVPEPTVNYCTNPSFENQLITTHSYVGWASSPAISSAWPYAARGTYFATATPTAGAEASVWKSWSYTEGFWTFSCDVYAYVGEEIELRILTGAGTIAANKFEVQELGWTRYSVTANLSGSGTGFMYLTVLNTNTGKPIYTDGWQMENKTYPTTYADGDMIGHRDSPPSRAYFWRGTPRASISERTAADSLGGVVVNFSDRTGFQTTSIIGLGLPSGDIRENQVGSTRRTVHDTVLDAPRDFTITGAFIECDFESLMESRTRMEEILRYDNTVRRDQALLRYRLTDPSGDPYGKTLQIPVVYNGGMAGRIDNFFQENVAIQFRAAEPRLQEIYDNSQQLDINSFWTNNGVAYRDEDGEWQRLGTGASTGFIFDNAIGVHPQAGGPEVPMLAGSFTQIAGDSVSYFAYWDGSSWNQIGNLDSNARFVLPAGYPSSRIYVGGAFANESGSPLRRLAYYDASGTFTQCGNGVDDVPNQAIVGPDGWLYVVGAFTSQSLANDLDYVLQYDPSGDTIYPFDASNPGMSDEVEDCCITRDGWLWICGDFTANGASDVMYGVARANLNLPYDQRTFEAVDSTQIQQGTWISAAPDGSVYLSALWPGGTYELRRWNGTAWEEIWDWSSLTPAAALTFWSPDGTGYLTGQDFEAPNIDQLAYTVTNVNQLGPVDWSPFGPYRMSFGRNKQILATGYNVASVYDVSGTVTTTVTNNGSSVAWPTIRITGQATLKAIINRTTGAEVWFNHGDDFNATVVSGENLFIDLSLGRIRMYSDLRPSVQGFLYVKQTSVGKFWLQPGDNKISLLLEDTDGSAEAWIIWKNNHWGLGNSL